MLSPRLRNSVSQPPPSARSPGDAHSLDVTLVNLFDRHGGAERCARDLLHGLLGRKHAARMLIGREDGRQSDRDERVVCLPRFYPEYLAQRVLRGTFGVTDTLMMYPLWHALRHPLLTGVDVVHFHQMNGSYLNLWSLPLIAWSTPMVMTLHDMWLLTGDCDHSECCTRWQKSCGACPLVRRPMHQRNSVGGADLTRFNLFVKRSALRAVPSTRLTLVSPSAWLAKQAAASHLGRFPIAVVPNGVDTAKFAPAARSIALEALGLREDRRYLTAVAGNWDNPHKGGRVLVEFAELLANSGLAKLLVVGQTSEPSRSRLAARGAVMLGGNLPAEDIRQVYVAADAALVFSRNENLPYAVSEPLACGCPVVARKIGGIPEMFTDGRHGWLVPPDAGASAYIRAVKALLTMPLAERRRQRQAVRAHAEQFFALDAMVGSYEKIYQSACREGTRRIAVPGRTKAAA